MSLADKVLGASLEEVDKIGQPIEVEAIVGSVRAGADQSGNVIVSMDIDDQGQLPSVPGQGQYKRIVFANKSLFESLINKGKEAKGKILFHIPYLWPDKRGQYWIRTFPAWIK